MISDTELSFSTELAHQILDQIITNAVRYCESNPLSELLARNKLEPAFPSSNDKIRVMCYNIMADSLSHHNAEVTKPFEAKYVDWSYRAPLIIKEIQAYDPDILCLQEIDKTNLTMHEAFGDSYDIFFKSRTGDKGDGCMTLVKKSKYVVLEKHFIEYYRDASDPLLNRDNVCVITVVRPKHGNVNDLFIVANTHILFSDNRGDIKTAQMYLAIKALNKLSYAERFKGFNIHFIYTGDFNTAPNSGIYEFLSKGKFDYREVRCNMLTAQRLGALKNQMYFRSRSDFLVANINHYRFDSRNIENKRDLLLNWILYLKRIDLEIKEPINDEPSQIGFKFLDPIEEINPLDERLYFLQSDLFLQSAYGTFQKFYYNMKYQQHPAEVFLPKYSTYEPLYTCRTVNSLMSVDYVWFSSAQNNRKMRVRSVIEAPRIDKVTRVFTFPNKIFPSDHFSLIVDFELLN